MKRILLFLLCLLPLLCFGQSRRLLMMAHTPSAVSSIWMTNGLTGGGNRNNFDDWIGGKIITSNSFTITDLGRYVFAGNSQSHTVALFSISGSLLTAGVINTSGQASNQFVYVPVTPYTVASQTAYYLVCRENSGGDSWLDAHQQYANGLRLDASGLSGGAFYSGGFFSGSTTNQTYTGPNFKFTIP